MRTNGDDVVMPQHIVWDWNGTLLSDNDAVVAAVNQVCASFGREAVTLDDWRAVFTRPIVRSYERLFGRSLSEDEWARVDSLYHVHYRERLPTCRLADGVPDLLHDWRNGGGSQSLLSMWFHDELVPLVGRLGLAELFARIDGLRADIGGGSKAEHLAEHLTALRLDPADVVLIGDVADDAHAAEHVGARCVLVSSGMGTREALVATGAPVATSIPDALDLIVRDRVA
ncbi:putative phosphatase [Gandjariella thermophila]|uniref:Putative phosphatase n=2 Tax=Gandjariella thermophila TaxID=1931992 RepID=A0A4D4J139_9PSEU|nr:putative phosphatase [Gandjariella thermophila]